MDGPTLMKRLIIPFACKSMADCDINNTPEDRMGRDHSQP